MIQQYEHVLGNVS